MTVKELIKLLKKYPEDLPVYRRSNGMDIPVVWVSDHHWVDLATGTIEQHFVGII